MKHNRIYQGKIVEIVNVERYSYQNSIIYNYELEDIKWSLFYKVGNYYIDLQDLKTYNLLNNKEINFLHQRDIDPRSLSLYTNKNISYTEIKRILKKH